MNVSIAVEGDTDAPVAIKLAADAGFVAESVYDSGGKGRLDAALRGYNLAAKWSPWLVLRDLDNDAECAPVFLRRKRFVPAAWMAYRLAVRQVEAWLLADFEAVAEFLSVAPQVVPMNPDGLANPKQSLVNLARRHSSRRAIRDAMVPREGDRVAVGPEYESAIIEFAQDHWSLKRAVVRSDSLGRARADLRRLATAWSQHERGRGG